MLFKKKEEPKVVDLSVEDDGEYLDFLSGNNLEMAASSREEVDRVICTIARLQDEITRITDIAASEIKRRENIIERVMAFQGPRLSAFCPKYIDKDKTGKLKRKYYVTGDMTARLFFRKTGGWSLFDSKLYDEFIQSMSEDSFKELGGETVRKLDYRLRGQLLKEGLHIPGYQFYKEEELGKMIIGGEKPFSVNKLKERVSSAFKGGESDDDDTV
jgi:hypothetical protein